MRSADSPAAEAARGLSGLLVTEAVQSDGGRGRTWPQTLGVNHPRGHQCHRPPEHPVLHPRAPPRALLTPVPFGSVVTSQAACQPGENL